MNEATAIAPREEAPVQSETAAIIQVIERAALNPDIDVEKMERLLAMQERVIARQAEQAFNEAMQAAKVEMPQVLRDAENSQTNSRYARLETVAKAVDPVITRHGFVPSFGTDVSQMEGHYRVTCALSHIGGHTRNYHVDVPSDGVGMKGTPNKTQTHAFGSTLSYGRRYLKLLIFDIATTDDDGNAAGGGFITEEQVAELRKLIDDLGAEEPKVCGHAKVASLDEIPAAKFKGIVTALNDWARKQRGMA